MSIFPHFSHIIRKKHYCRLSWYFSYRGWCCSCCMLQTSGR